MKCSLSDIEGLSAEIENLRTCGPEELDQTWRDLVGSDRPRRVCGDLLIKALGYRLQEKAIGGLKPSTRRLLERWGRNGSWRGPLAESARTLLKAGIVLVREWHGATHRVTVLDDGFDFDGERFRSLSWIARKITGVRWSGPLFFGLRSSAKEQRFSRDSPVSTETGGLAGRRAQALSSSGDYLMWIASSTNGTADIAMR
jgi:hypothetical protein